MSRGNHGIGGTSSNKFTITGFINVPVQRSFRGDPDGNTLWLWNPVTDAEDIKPDLSPTANLGVVKKGRAPYPYLKIRFEGMDTPETHFNGGDKTPGPMVKQNYGYLARDQLFQLLGQSFEGGQDNPDVSLECHLNTKGKYYDSHKRVVGNVYLKGQEDSLNTQMMGSGYAFPMFYESMDQDDISTLREHAQQAYDSDAGAWREYTVTPVDGKQPIPAHRGNEINDWGDVNYPKFWRRWISYNYDPNGRPFETFVDWLAHLPNDKMADGSKVDRFSKAISAHDYRMLVMPHDLVFRDE
jgi:endonuclease YncB( thermonuclease family)